MNIVYLHSHDTGRCIQPYGYSVDTPNLQSLADESVVFRQAFTVNPTCSPSRAALLTGTYPHQNGMLGLAHNGFSLHNYSGHLVQVLKENGYTTALSGIQHEDNLDGLEYARRIGYDEILYPRPGETEEMFASGFDLTDERAVEFLNRPHDKPFFLSVGCFETHRLYPEPVGINPDTVPLPGFLPDTPDTREDMAGYLASLRKLDERIGNVLRALDENGLRDNTLVICTTDHGLALPGCKCNLTDRGMGVFFMLRGPGVSDRPRHLHTPVTHLDLFPTLCDLLQIPPPHPLEGTSLLPLLREQTETVHAEIFGELNTHAAPEPTRCVRTDRWKYIRRYSSYPHPVYPNCDGSPVKKLYVKHGWLEQALEDEELYDLHLDPGEQKNLRHSEEHQSTLSDLRKRLDEWMEQTDDPLRKGYIPLPPTAKLRPPDAASLSQLYETPPARFPE